MKSILIKTLLIINLFFVYNCKAQTTTDYITFYNDVVPKLNTIVPNKAQYYGQNFSNLNNELLNKNIYVITLDYDSRVDEEKKYYVLTLFFADLNLWNVAIKNSFQLPAISITFESEIPKQIENLAKQNNMQWNSTISQFFANMKIESIRFIGLNGYNSTDNSLK
ncbi:hypothetical protein [Chryseobacterium sp. Hurlbut01]|uniref:hypothetical protein n=1 Tax=Chryseobacterium sp. Hurlbut01 TaxID=1681828 RepID=UPI00067C2E25|nr:hypothetical protein [Chryseobacterium sp. Hurlbut01]KNB62478.1 hypothetical protein AC804_06505 [Chryseobacterium sp. Hurlbut01]